MNFVHSRLRRVFLKSIEDILNSFGGESRIEMGLDRFLRALEEVGHPENRVKSIVIGGTNGKGTTALLVSNALVEHGFRVGTYLSPHLQIPNERMLSGLMPIPGPLLLELAHELFPLAHRCKLTYFEFLTLIYFHWAAQSAFDYSILEVGLGGRLDATNVTHPIATAITNIELDHQAYLGSTREEILKEKLGITRPEVPLYTGITDPVLLSMCGDAISSHSPMRGPRTLNSRSWIHQEVTIDGIPLRLRNPSSGTVENAALALTLLRGTFGEVSPEEVQRGFWATLTPGRFEVVKAKATDRLILSGDHNPHGIESLIATLDSLPSGRVHVLCAFSLDKPYREMFAGLKSRSISITLSTLSKNRESALPSDYASLATIDPDPHAALRRILASAAPDDTVIVTGSLYFVGEIRNRLDLPVEFRASQPGQGAMRRFQNTEPISSSKRTSFD